MIQVPNGSRIDVRSPLGYGRLWGRITWGLTGAYAVSVFGLVCLLWSAGDQWWPATVFLFGPRWPILTPLLLLAPLGLAFCRQVLPWLFGVLILALVPLMGLSLPWQRVSGFFPDASGLTLRVVTYNCGHTTDEAVIQMARVLRPDILTLNEWHASRPLPEALTEGRQIGRAGGNVVLSRFPIEDLERLQSDRLAPWELPSLRCRLRTGAGLIQIVCLHLETPRQGLSEVRHSLWRGAEAMRRNTEKRRFEAELASGFAEEFAGPAVVAGDFNTPVESRIYRRYWSDWQNAFSQAGFGLGYTKFTRFFGVRIDHILVNSRWRVTSAWVGPDLGGDHRPVVAEIALRP